MHRHHNLSTVFRQQRRLLSGLLLCTPSLAWAQQPATSPPTPPPPDFAAAAGACQQELGLRIADGLNWHTQAVSLQAQLTALQKQYAELQDREKEHPATPPVASTKP